MKRPNIIILALLFLLSLHANAQVTISPSAPTIPCGGSVTLNGSPSANDVNVAFQADDSYSALTPIGFGFNFYGTVYNDLLISSNGYLSFNNGVGTVAPGAFSPWSIANPIFANAALTNSVAGLYTDLDFRMGGMLLVGNRGIAPNRQFVVTYCNVPLFGCNTLTCTFQIILFEGSNNIEVHIQQRSICPVPPAPTLPWNNNAGIEGVENAANTAGTAGSGRNHLWNTAVTNVADRFTPNGSYTAYTTTAIPFSMWPTAVTNWYVGTTLVGTGSSITVSPSSTTTYQAVETSCGATASGFCTVTVTPLVAGAIVGPLTKCSGESATYTNPTGAVGGTWSMSPILPGSSINSTTGAITFGAVSVPTPVTVTYSVSSPPCTASSSITVMVNPLPDIPTITEISGNRCVGNMLTFKVHGQPGMHIGYWILPYSGPIAPMAVDVALDGGGDFIFSLPAIDPTTIFCIGYIQNPATGCRRNLTLELPITVCPRLKGGEITGPRALCQGTSGSYSTSGDPGGYWSVFSSYGVCTTTGPSTGEFTPNPGVVGTVTITYHNSNCCNSVQSTFNVLVNPLPDLPVITEISGNRCVGEMLTFKVHGQPGMHIGYGILPFSGPIAPLAIDVALDGAGDFILTLPALDPTTTFSIVYIENPITGCRRYNLTIELSITVCPRLKGGKITGPKALCQGSSGSYATTGDPGGYWSVSPSDGMCTTTGPSTATFIPDPGVTGTVTITYYNSNCCNSIRTTFNVFINPPPTASMWCESSCDSLGASVAVLHFSGLPGLIVSYTDGVMPVATVTLDPISGDASATVPITGSATFSIPDVEDPVTHCHSKMTIRGCTVSPVVEPVVVCSTTYDPITGLFHAGYQVLSPILAPGEFVVVHFSAHAYDLYSACTVPVVRTITDNLFNEITPCTLPPACSLTSCSTALIGALNTSYIEYRGCSWENTCSSYASKPGHSSADGSGLATFDENTVELSIVPNPNNGDFTLKGQLQTANNATTAKIEVMDLLGKVVLYDDCTVEKGKINKQITIGNNLANGVYIIKVKNDNESYVVRFTLDR